MRYVYILLGMSALFAGCSSCERYYCDDTGCFSCDGVGCREITPTPHPMCRGDFECTAEAPICSSLGCVAACTADAECARGQICRANYCVAPTEPNPTPTPGTCTTSAQCPEAGLLCVDGRCTRDTGCAQAGCSCDVTAAVSSCAAGFQCVSGMCRAENDICQFNMECGAGRLCVDGSCAASCAADRPCATGQTCDARGFCVAAPPVPTGCGANAACGTGQVCINAVCVQQCSGADDASCGAGRYCRDMLCAIDDRPMPFCTENSQCRYACINGVCRTPCDTSEQCARVDVQFGFCLEAYCVTTNEATSNCSLSQECEGQMECIDGVCR